MTALVTTPHPLIADAGLARLKDFVIEHTGLTYYANRDEDLADRICRRLLSLGLNDCSSYLRLLRDEQAGAAEFDSLVSELTIGETYFFRHQELFDALRDTILPDVIQRKKHVRRLRVWSAGCATGPETYSLAILLKRELAHLTEGWELSIVGTDINRDFLARANEGRYEEWAFRCCPDGLRESCFDASGKSWTVKPRYRQCVSFQYHNLVKHQAPSLLHNLAAFDLILCRNVMIYFNNQVIRTLLGHFERCLVDGGWLLVGHSEPNIELFQSFRTVNTPGATLYQKCETTESRAAHAVPRPAAAAIEIPAFVSLTPPAQLPVPLPVAAAAPAAPQQTEAHAAAASEALNNIRILADQGECEKALRLARTLLQNEKLNPAAYLYHALVLQQMGNFAETERSLRQALYLDRGFVLAHYYLGLCLQRKRETRAAMRSFQNVLDCLARTDSGATFPHGDGITAGDLRELAEMNLEVLQQP